MTGWYGKDAAGTWPVDRWLGWLAGILGREGPDPRWRPVRVGTVTHGITRYRITAETWLLDLRPPAGEGAPPRSGDGPRPDARPAFHPPGEGWPPVSRLVTKACESLG